MYVSTLLRAYNTESKVFETLSLAERSGVTMVQVDPACFGVIEKYRKEQGSKIQAMVCIHPNPDEAADPRGDQGSCRARGRCALHPR